MKGKFFFAGHGAKIPGTEFGLSAAQFKLWLQSADGEWRGYTTASNQALSGSAIIESKVVEFHVADPDAAEAFASMHGDTIEATISSTLFAIDGGIAKIAIKRLDNGDTGEREIAFHCDECKGFSAALGDIHFTATLYQLPQGQWDGEAIDIVP